MKQLVIGLAAGIAVFSIGSIGLTHQVQAKTTYLPAGIRHHVWYRTTSGTEGGFHDRTTFKGNTMTFKTLGYAHANSTRLTMVTVRWQFKNLKHTSKWNYYGRKYYTKTKYELVKIHIKNAHQFDLIPKHFAQLRGNYTGNEDYGATIFKR